jgi:hypothetical protein
LRKSAAAPALFRKWGNHERYPGEITADCTIEKLAVQAKLEQPFRDAIGFVANETDESVAGVLVQTDRGWYRTPWRRWTHDHTDPGCMHSRDLKILELSSPNPAAPLVWMRMLNAESYWMQMVPSPSGGGAMESTSWTTWQETLDACRIDSQGGIDCDKTVTLAEARTESGSPDSPRDKPPFAHRSRPAAREDGKVEIVP